MSTQSLPAHAGRITHYTVEITPTMDLLIQRVNAKIEQGWQPQGGIAVDYPTHAVLPNYAQALVWRAGEKP